MGTTASNLFRGGASAPKRLRRASDLPAIQSVEDLFPPEVFFKTVAGGYLEAEEIGNVACANRQFKETSYNPRMTTGRGCVALIGQGCSPSVPEAKKWFKIAAELHGTREALLFLGEWASGGTTTFMKFFVRSRSADPVDPVEAETLFRAAVAADDSPSESYCIFAPAGHALDVARIGLATMLLRKGGDDALVEAATLLDAVLDHENIPADQQQQMRRPNSEARALRAEIILQQQAPGALAEALELVEAIPEADLEGIEGSNCAYMLGKVYKTLDEENPNDEHARRAWEHIGTAVGEGHPRSAFDMGELAERGRGTPVHLLTAYTGYVMAAQRQDERAIARLRETIAAGPPLPMELMVAIVRARQYSDQADGIISGNATFEQAMEHMNDPAQTLAALGIPAPDHPAPQ